MITYLSPIFLATHYICHIFCKFKDEGFVKECLNDFDANIAKVEAEYAVTGKYA